MKIGQFVLGHQLNSDQINARLLNYPMATIPDRKINENTSPIGIDRAILFDDKAYNNREVELMLGFEGKDSEKNIQKFLSKLDTGGYVDFQMYSDPDYIYQVARLSTATITRPSYSDSYRELNMTLSCAPFKYLDSATKTVSVKAGTDTIITNPTSFNAKPIIKITSTGDTSLTVNGKTLNIKDVQKEITLNSELQDAYVQEGYTVTNVNNQVSVGAYPILKPGDNTIKLTSGTANVETRWRTI